MSRTGLRFRVSRFRGHRHRRRFRPPARLRSFALYPAISAPRKRPAGFVAPSMRRLADVKRKKHKRIEPGQSLPFLLLRIVPASRRDPVKAERSEPQGSLDGVARCERLEWEGMAGWRARQVLGLWDLTTSHPFALFFELPLSSVLVGFLFVSWCCHHLTGLGRKSVWFPLRP